MNNIQDILSQLPPITAMLLVIVALLTALIRLIDQIQKLWSRLRPAMKYLALLATQIVPIGMGLWYFMYWAVQYHGFFTQPIVFSLLVAEPTILIIAYEMFWGIWLYPKLPFIVKQNINRQQSSDTKKNEGDK